MSDISDSDVLRWMEREIAAKRHRPPVASMPLQREIIVRAINTFLDACDSRGISVRLSSTATLRRLSPAGTTERELLMILEELRVRLGRGGRR